MNRKNVWTFDLEADGLLEEAAVCWCGTFKNKFSKELKSFRPHQIQDMLSFMDTCDVLIGHNVIGYDFPLLQKLYKYKFKGKKVDTLIISRLLDPQRKPPPNCPNRSIGGNSVEAWGWRVGRGKVEHEDWSQFTEAMMHRNVEDVEIQELIYDALMQEAKGGNWREAFLLTFELFENLQKQEEYGWLVDQPHMDRCISQLSHWIRKIDLAVVPRLPYVLEVEENKQKGEYGFLKKPFLKSGAYSQAVSDWMLSVGLDPDLRPVSGPFSRILYRPVDLNSNDETKNLLLSMGWEPQEWNTNDEGQRTSPKMSKTEEFEGVEGKVGKLIARRVQARHRRSQIEGLKDLIRPDGRVASVVNTLAVTGRATHRNIVNIPKESSFYGHQMRSIFTTREGYVLVGTDSDSCQLRMLAGRMGSQAYIDAILTGDKAKGTDNHSLTKKAADLESRDIAKNVMYCLLFGGGDVKLGKTALKPGKGAEVRKALYKGLDGLEDLVGRLTKEWKATAKKRFNPKFNRMEYYDGMITGLDGRPIKVPSEHMLLVYLLQSDESIMMTKAYNLANERLSERFKYGEDFGFVVWMHDEYQVECRVSIADEVCSICEQAIVDAGKFFNILCPHKGDSNVGRNWAETH